MRRPELRHAQDASPHTDHASPATPRLIGGSGLSVTEPGQGASSIGVDTAHPATHLVQLYRSWGFAEVDSIHWPGKTYDSVVMLRPLGKEGR